MPNGRRPGIRPRIPEESVTTGHEEYKAPGPDYSRKPGPIPPPGRFKSFEQLRLWAGERFPRATVVTHGIDLKGSNRIAGVLDGLAIDWPGVAAELGWITTRHPFWDDHARGVIAAGDAVFGEKIAFNPFYFRRLSRLHDAASLGERIGLYPRGAGAAGERYFVSHEWGHLLYAWLRHHRPLQVRDLIALFARDPRGSDLTFDPEKAAAISQYARRGVADTFADAFSVIQWGSADRWPEILRQCDRILGGAS